MRAERQWADRGQREREREREREIERERKRQRERNIADDGANELVESRGQLGAGSRRKRERRREGETEREIERDREGEETIKSGRKRARKVERWREFL